MATTFSAPLDAVEEVVDGSVVSGLMRHDPLHCIYCPNVLTAETRLAHVVPEALGGRLASRETCCKDCNTALSKVEGRVAKELRPFAGALGIRRQRHPAPPALVEHPEHGKLEVRRGEASLPGVRRKLRPAVNGIETLELRAYSKEELVDAIVDRLFQMKKTPEDLARGENVSLTPLAPIPSNLSAWFEINLGTIDQRRLAVKIAVELLASQMPSLARRRELAAARSFARHGESPVPSTFDARAVGPGVDLSRTITAPFRHTVEVWTTTDQLLVARVVLFGFFPFACALAPRFDPLIIAHAIDPLTGESELLRSPFYSPSPRSPFVSTRPDPMDGHSVLASAMEAYRRKFPAPPRRDVKPLTADDLRELLPDVRDRYESRARPESN